MNHVSLDSIFSVADFYDSALRLIDDIHARDKIPLMVGGSMMYFSLLKKGISNLPSADLKLRDELEQKILTNGLDALHADLIKLDPEAGQNIDPHDSQRIIRAIEIIISTNMSLNENLSSEKSSALKEKYTLIEFGIFPQERSKLHERIESRQEILVGDNYLRK